MTQKNVYDDSVECRVKLSPLANKVAKKRMFDKDITSKGVAINDILEEKGEEEK